MPKNNQTKSGMVALFPAIIISGILLVIIVSESQSFLSALWRGSLAEEKTQSNMIVRACLRHAVAKRIQNTSYQGNETIKILNYDCEIEAFIPKNGMQDIGVSVTVADAKSIGLVTYNPITQKIYNEDIF